MNRQGSIAGLFFETAERFGDRPFLHAPRETRDAYRLRDGDYTYAQALARIRELREKYQRAGCGPGVRVGLAFENRPEFFLHFLALNALGASVMPLNGGMPRDELARQIAHSDCALIVATPEHAGAIEDAARRAPLSPPVNTPDRAAFAAVQARHESPGEAAASLEAAILYTSGTTGEPKGCLLSNDYFLAIGDLYTELGGYVRFEAGRERIITPLPVTHMNALACSFMAAIRTGSCLIQLDRFHPKSWWRTVRESRATIMHYLGVMPAMLLSAPESADEDFSGQIKFAFGAGCDPRHHARFEERFGVRLIEAWAMTETGAGAWITASAEPRHVGTRCFGKAPNGLETRLVDEEGRDVARGLPGELLVRRAGADPRASFFSGYFRDEAATDDAWRDGWFHTGDAVRQDDEGYFYFVDRLKNVIRRSGENIAAIDVESVLMRHAGVAGCVVIPVPDEIRGDFLPIRTNVPGIYVSEMLPLHAKCADKYTLIRSIHHEFADHGGGHKRFLTGRRPAQPDGFVNDAPAVPTIVSKCREHITRGLPNVIQLTPPGREGVDTFSHGAAYLGPAFNPFIVGGNPSKENFEVRNLALQPGVARRLDDRMTMLKGFDRMRRDLDASGTMDAMDTYNRRAMELLTSSAAREAFDLSKEKPELRARYDNHAWGQRALLGRRLIEAGCSFVTVVMENPAGGGPIRQEIEESRFGWIGRFRTMRSTTGTATRSTVTSSSTPAGACRTWIRRSPR